LCYLPAFQQYGLKFFSYTEALGGGSAEAILRRATLGVWGPIGCLALAAALVYTAATGWTIKNQERAKARAAASAACVSAIVLYTMAYLKLPHEAGYLIPLVPFSIWLVALWIATPAAVVFGALLCASPFVDYRDRELNLVGPVVADHRERLAVEIEIRKIVDAAARLQQPAVLVAGYRLPAIEAKLGGQKNESQRWLYSIKNNEQLDGFRSKGFKIYFVDRATENYQKRINGLQLRQLGAKQLPLDP
jgi:hypothetical protein